MASYKLVSLNLILTILTQIKTFEYLEKQNNQDFVSLMINQCLKSSENCFESLENHYSKCVNNYYLQNDDQLSIGNCEYFMYQKVNLKECIYCQLQGCEECISTTQCFESFQILDGLYYLIKNICSNQQLYDTNLANCTYSCMNNYVEEQIQQLCLNFDDHQDYSEDQYQQEQNLVNYIEFSNFHYIVYNHACRSISLFKKDSFKDSIVVASSKFRVQEVVKLIKIGVDKLLFNYKNFILFAQVNVTNSKIIQICQEYVQISINEIYFFQNEGKQILIIEDWENKLFELNIESMQKNKKITLNYNNNQQKNVYFSQTILNKFLLFYQKNILHSFDFNLKKLTVIEIKIDEIALIYKLEQQNHLKNVKGMKKADKSEERYLNNERITNVNNSVLYQSLLIINQDENKIWIYDLNKQNIITEISINYVVLNIYIEIERRLIIIVGNLGICYIYNYELKVVNQINSPCTHKTKTLSDEFYLYLFCAKQIDIYDKQSLERIYPSIRFGLQSLNKIIFTKQKDIFILVGNESIIVVKFFQEQKKFQIIFQKDKQQLVVVNWQVIEKVTLFKYLEITVILINGIANYKISLEQLQTDTLKYNKSNLNSFNYYIPINIEKNMALSSQLSKQRRITHENNLSFYEPNLSENTVQDQINNNYQKDTENFIIWTDQSIINDNKQNPIKINDAIISTEGSNPIIIIDQTKKNSIVLEKIKIFNIKQKIIFKNFKSVVLKNITFDKFIDYNKLTSIIEILDCTIIEIYNLNITNNSSFNNTNQIILFQQSKVSQNNVTIQNITIQNSIINSLFYFKNLKNISIANAIINHSLLQKNLFLLEQAENLIINNVQLNNIKQSYYFIDNYDFLLQPEEQIVEQGNIYTLFKNQNPIISLSSVQSNKIQDISIKNSNISSFFSAFQYSHIIENIIVNNTYLQKSLISIINGGIVTIQNVDLQNIKWGDGDFFDYNNSTYIQLRKNEYNSIISMVFLINANISDIKIQNSSISTLFYAEQIEEFIQIQNLNIINTTQLTYLNSIISLNPIINKLFFKQISISNSNISTMFRFKTLEKIILTYITAKDIQLKKNLFEIILIHSVELSLLDLKNITGGQIIRQHGCNQVKFVDITLKGLQNIIILKQLSGFMFEGIVENYNLTIQNLNVLDSKNIQFFIKSFNVIIDTTVFKNISEQDGNLIKFQTQLLNISNSNFIKISSNVNNYAIIQIKNFDRISSKDTLFESNKIQLIKISNQNEAPSDTSDSLENQFIKFNNLTILNNSCNTSLIQIQDSRNLTVINSTFKENKSFLDGGCLCLEEIENIKLENSQFEQNHSLKQGGAVYFKWSSNQKQYFNISECRFIKNEALFGKGGALFLSNVDFNMENSKIQSNTALIGGGIFYEIIIPDLIDKNKIQILKQINGNNAIIYGNNIGSTLRDMKFIPQNLLKADYSFDIDHQTKQIQIKNFQSGSYLSLDKINFIDEEGQEIFVNFKLLNSDEQKQELDKISISIESVNINIQGEMVQLYRDKDKGFKYEKLNLSFFPNENAEFILNSKKIEGLLYSDRKNLYIPEKQFKLKFLVNFRECEIGEIKKDVLKQIICEKCPDGKYSINFNDSVCKICPQTAISCQGSQIILSEGYWRKSNTTDIISPCINNYQSCKPEDPFSKFGCSVGYIGPLCESCDIYGNVWNDRYSFLLSTSSCMKCSQNMFIIILSAIIFYIFQFLQISFALSRIFDQVYISLYVYYMKLGGILYLSKSEYIKNNPVFQKILTDHLQILSIVRSFQTEIPSSLNLFTDVIGNPFDISSTSFDCIFDFKSFSLIPIWVYKFLQSIALPIVLIASYILFQKLKILFKLNHIHSRYYVTIIVYIYLHFFPSMITLIIKSINCRLIGDEYYSQSDLNISCGSYEKRGKYLYFLIIPFAFVFALFLPVCLFLKIRNQKVFIQSKVAKSRFKFIFDSYKDNLYFWDMTRLGYKSLIMITSMILQQYPLIKICIINIILFLFFQIQFKLQPYKSHFYNYLESRSSKICIFTLNMCLLYLLSYSYFQILSQLTLILIYLFNGFFTLQLIYLIFKEPIPAEKNQRNCFQNQLVKLKKKLPNLLKCIKIQHKITMKSLLKIKKLKNYLKILTRFKIQTQEEIDTNYQTMLTNFIQSEQQYQDSPLMFKRQVQLQQLQQSRQLFQELSIQQSVQSFETPQQQTTLQQIQLSEQLQTIEQTSAIIRSSDINDFISFNEIININKIK